MLPCGSRRISTDFIGCKRRMASRSRPSRRSAWRPGKPMQLPLRRSMRRIREIDQSDTVVMVQPENEAGILQSMDYSPAGQAGLALAVPERLIKYLQAPQKQRSSAVQNAWELQGRPTAGSWTEVFGDNPEGASSCSPGRLPASSTTSLPPANESIHSPCSPTPGSSSAQTNPPASTLTAARLTGSWTSTKRPPRTSLRWLPISTCHSSKRCASATCVTTIRC